MVVGSFEAGPVGFGPSPEYFSSALYKSWCQGLNQWLLTTQSLSHWTMRPIFLKYFSPWIVQHTLFNSTQCPKRASFYTSFHCLCFCSTSQQNTSKTKPLTRKVEPAVPLTHGRRVWWWCGAGRIGRLEGCWRRRCGRGGWRWVAAGVKVVYDWWMILKKGSIKWGR